MKKITFLLAFIGLAFFSASAQCNITANFTQSNSGLTASFTNASTCNTCASTSYNWYFGDGSFSNQVNPSHAYTAAGNYTVSLVAYGIDSMNSYCADSTAITITVNAGPCNVSFSNFVNYGVGNFTTSITGGTAPFTYLYDYGDGSPNQTTSNSYTNHLYSTIGTYYPCVTVTDALNNTCSVCDTITIVNTCWTTNFVTVSGQNVGSSPGAQPPIMPYTHTYTLQPGNLSNTTGQFNGLAMGSYQLCAVATDTLNQTCVAKCDSFVINSTTPSNCIVNDYFSTSGPVGMTYSFTSSSFNNLCPTCTSLTRLWDFGDGSTSTLSNPSHTYTSPGLYQVRLKTTGIDAQNDSCTDTNTRIIITVGLTYSCTANLTSVANGNTVNFTATGAGIAAPLTYTFDFHDGSPLVTNSTGTVSHTYSTNINYYQASVFVMDTALNYCFASDSAGLNTCITTLNTGVNGSTITAIANGNGGQTPYTYSYTLTPGNITNNTGIFTGLTSGSYTVCATSTDNYNNQCISACQNVSITAPAPPCGLIASYTQNTVGLTTNFTSTTSCNGCSTISYIWNFGDGNSSTQANPTHIYTSAGNYWVTLYITATDSNSNTCYDSMSTNISAQAPLGCSIYLTTSVVQLTATFTPVVTNAVAPLSYFYNYGDGNSGLSNIHTYALPGNYYPCITVVDANSDTCYTCDSIAVANNCNTSVASTVSGSTITAVGSASWGTAPYTYSYTLNPGNITNSTGIFSGLASGGYLITATATDALNQICTPAYDSATIGNSGPCSTTISTFINGNTVGATATAVGGTGPYTYTYTLNPGNFANSTGFFSGLANGNYVVCATAFDANQNICSSDCDSITIGTSTSCNTSIQTIASGNTITATASATGSVGPYTYLYTLLPNNISNTTGVFTSLPPGQYAICAISFDGNMDSCSIACDSAIVGGTAPCTTSIVASASGNTITAVGTSTGGAAPYLYTYTLNPGNITNNSGVFTSLPTGYYAVCVTATDTLNQSCNIACDSVLVGGPGNCFATAAFSETITSNTVQFTNSSTIANGIVLNNGWFFGDGNTSTQASPTHTYNAAGTYQVILAISGIDSMQNSCIDSVSKFITVGPTSVNNINANKLTIYPNPTNQNFVIDLPTNENFQKLVITDVSGRVISTEPNVVNGNKLSVSLQNNANGIYFIKLQTDKNFYTSSIMKQE